MSTFSVGSHADENAQCNDVYHQLNHLTLDYDYPYLFDLIERFPELENLTEQELTALMLYTGKMINESSNLIEYPEKPILKQNIKKRDSKGFIKKIGRTILGKGYVYLMVDIEYSYGTQRIKNILPDEETARKVMKINSKFVDDTYEIKVALHSQKQRALVSGVPIEKISEIHFEPPFYKIQCSNDAGAGDKRHIGRVKDLAGNTVCKIEDNNDNLIEFVSQNYHDVWKKWEDVISQYEKAIEEYKGRTQQDYLSKLNFSERYDFVNQFLDDHFVPYTKHVNCNYSQKPICVEDSDEIKTIEIYRTIQTEGGERDTHIGNVTDQIIADKVIHFLKEQDIGLDAPGIKLGKLKQSLNDLGLTTDLTSTLD